MKKIKVISCLVLINCLMGCGLQQRTSTTNKEKKEYSKTSDVSLSEMEQVLLEAQSLTLFTDSTHQDYQVQLWPKGPFTYSASTGFEGEAEKVVISGDIKGLKKGTGSSMLKTNASSQAELESKTSAKLNMDKSEVIKKAAPSAWFVFAALLLLAVLILYFLRFKF